MLRWCGYLLLVCLVSLALAKDDDNGDYTIIDADDEYVYKDPKIIDDVLADKYGQCPIPFICFTNRKGCDLNVTDVTIVNCTHRNAGPYVPIFKFYTISARAWDFDFSNNYIQALDHTSFYTADPINPVPINFTRLDLSHNFIRHITAEAFRGNVTKQLVFLDLSYNKLTRLEEGVFSDMPVLETLDLSHNMLYSIDSMCSALLPRVQILSVEYNRISSLASGCFGTSRLRNSGKLILSNNAIGSINDCSYERINSVNIDNNPVICGCSNKFPSAPCWRRQPDNTFEKTTERSCYKTTSSCSDINFNITYKLIGQKSYQIFTALPGDTMFDATLYEYENFELSVDDPEMDETTTKNPDSDDLKITVLSTAANTKNLTDMDTLKLERSKVYTLCVNRYQQTYQTKCSVLAPPPAPYASKAVTIHTGLMLLIHTSMLVVVARFIFNAF